MILVSLYINIVTGGSPNRNEVLELNTNSKTWSRVGTTGYDRYYSAASVVNSRDILNICIENNVKIVKPKSKPLNHKPQSSPIKSLKNEKKEGFGPKGDSIIAYEAHQTTPPHHHP